MVRRRYEEQGGVTMQLHTIGIDLGKTVFHLVGLNQRGEAVVRKKFSRKQLMHFTANLQVELIGMEACGGSLSRACSERAGSRGAADASAVCQAVRKN
jgi:transposase